jgi:hypothetical protein
MSRRHEQKHLLHTWSAIDSEVAQSGLQDAQRDNRKRFVLRAGEELTAFLELESTIRATERPEDCGGREIKLDSLSRTILEPLRLRHPTVSLCLRHG